MSRRKITESLIQLANVRNILDNGGFEIWQRGAGPFTTNGSYTVDRWKMYESGASLQVDRTVGDSNYNHGEYDCRCTVSGATGTGYAMMAQMVENYKSYRGKTVSLSVKVYTTVADKVRVWLSDEIINTFSDYHTGSGWETLTVTKTVDDSLTDLQVWIGMYTNDDTNGVFFIDNAMLVIGDEPVDYVPVMPAEEWERCQRYYHRITNMRLQGYAAGAGQDCRWYITLPASMASSPTYTVSGGTSLNTSPHGVYAAGSDNKGFTYGCQAIAGGVLYVSYNDDGYVEAEVT